VLAVADDPPGEVVIGRLDAIERMLSTAPAEAAAELEQLSRSDEPEVRVQALAVRAIHEASGRSDGALRRARELLFQAELTGCEDQLTRARLAHARGYVAFREASDAEALRHLNQAATLYEGHDRPRARVFDVLGMLLTRRGDLDGAHDYFALSLALKQADPTSGPEALALTCGNLGRLELTRERYAEAETWLWHDLGLVEGDRPATRAHVHNQLALSLLGQGSGRYDLARAHLDQSLSLAPEGSVTRGYALLNLAQLEIRLRRGDEARTLAAEASRLARSRQYAELEPWLLYLDAQLATLDEGPTALDRALALHDEAYRAFEARTMPSEACEVALGWAALLLDAGRPAEAREVLEPARRLADLHLFRQENPLARLEALLARAGSDGPAEVLRARLRRMLGGVSEHWLLEQSSGEYHARRLHGERARVTVWTCDIRGFTEYCNRTSEPQRVVKMLNRFFARVGQAILDGGGCIDKYVGDSILAYFQGPDAPARAADTSIEAFRRVAELNEERAHLGEIALEMGIGLATGPVVEGNVGFAGKLEHTIIGTPVNAACRLVARAASHQTLLDEDTAQGLDAFDLRAVPGDTLDLKGLGAVRAYELLGRRSRAPSGPPSSRA
jgi:class 3 adenylate cyclase